MSRLVDRRLLFECAVTHYATLNATAEQLDELDRLTRDMAESADWSDYHQADEQFHQLMGTASGLGTAVEAYHETLTELYAYFLPLPHRAAAQIKLRPRGAGGSPACRRGSGSG